jgi:hypothetical protein
MVEPGLRQQNPRRHQRHARLQPETLGSTAPRPVLRLTDEASRHRPSFHHHATPDQRATRRQGRDGHRHRVSGGVMGGSQAGSPYPVDQRAEHLRSPRCHHEIPRVRKQAEGQQLHWVCLQQVAQCPEQHSVFPRSPQLCLRRDQAAGDVEVAGSGTSVGHRVISSGVRETQARCQMPLRPAFAETLP